MKADELENKIDQQSLLELKYRSKDLSSWLVVDIYIEPYIEENDLPEYCSFHDGNRKDNRTHASIRIRDIPKLVKIKEITYI